MSLTKHSNQRHPYSITDPRFEYNGEGALCISSLANECFDAWNFPQFNTLQVTALDSHLSNILEVILCRSDDVKLCH